MKIFITGACGWIARLVIADLEQRHELVLMDRVDPAEATVFTPGSDTRAHVPLVTQWPYTRAEITDVAAVRAASEGADAALHLAAQTSGAPEIGAATMDSNVTGTFIVLDAARLAGAKRVVAASSINAYGTVYWRLSGKPSPYTTLPLDESFSPVPEDPYSLSKVCGELACDAFTRAYGLTTASLRFGPVWSDTLYDRALAVPKPTDHWSDDLFSWVHVRDITQAVVKALECPTLPPMGAYTLTAADTRCPEPSMGLVKRFRPDLAAAMSRPLVGRESLVSIERAKAGFGYEPVHRLGE